MAAILGGDCVDADAGISMNSMPFDATPLYQRYWRWYERLIAAIGHRRSLRDYFARRLDLRQGLRVLDAGCGSGASLAAIFDAARNHHVDAIVAHGFDASPAMLAAARRRLSGTPRGISLCLLRARLLDDALPTDWKGFDLAISSGMLEYLPKRRLAEALKGLGDRLAPAGRLVFFISKDSAWNRLFIRGLWKAELWSEREIRAACAEADLIVMSLEPFRRWGYAVEAIANGRRIAHKADQGIK